MRIYCMAIKQLGMYFIRGTVVPVAMSSIGLSVVAVAGVDGFEYDNYSGR